MNQAQLSNLFNGDADTSRLEPEIESAISKYPYFANLYVLRAKLLHDQQDERFATALNKAAARTLSRRRLKHLIEGPVTLELVWSEKSDLVEEPVSKADFEVDEPENDPVQNEEVAAEKPHETIEKLVEISSSDENAEKPIPKNEFGFRFVKKGKTSIAKKQPKPEEKAFELKSLEKKQPLQKRNQKDAIDFFLEKSPSISSPKIDFGQTREQPDLSVKSVSLEEEIVTENMALIYMKQRNFARALDIYRKLELKFPEKRTYFAALIKNLENTIV